MQSDLLQHQDPRMLGKGDVLTPTRLSMKATFIFTNATCRVNGPVPDGSIPATSNPPPWSDAREILTSWQESWQVYLSRYVWWQ